MALRNVYVKDYNTYAKIYELKGLLIQKLEKCGMEVDHETPFADLIHMVKDIPSVLYDVNGNEMPTDELNPIDSAHSLMRFELDLWQRIKYYNKWLRYYLVLKGVDIETINQVSTLKEHILLIDKIDRIKGSRLTISPFSDSLNYGSNNTIPYQIRDENGVAITEGYIIVKQNGQVIKKIPAGETLSISPTSTEHQEYEIYYEGTDRFLESEHIEVEFDVEAGNIKCTIEMVNTNKNSPYYNDSNQGLPDDDWQLTVYTATANGVPLKNIPFDIYIDGIAYMTDVETDANGLFTLYIGSLDVCGDVQVSVVTKSNDEDMKDSRAIYELSILYDRFVLESDYDYAGKDEYEFAIIIQDEEYGVQYVADLNGNEIHFNFNGVDGSAIIEDGKAVIPYESTLESGDYPITWEYDGKTYTDIITIRSNFIIPDKTSFYLNEFPRILFTPNGIIEENKKVGIWIKDYGNYLINSLNDDSAMINELEQAINEYNSIGFFRTDADGYIILPEELKSINYVDMMLYASEESLNEVIEYSYELHIPFKVEQIDYVRQEYAKYKITVYDKEDFNPDDPISEYITIDKKNGMSVDYISYVNNEDDCYIIYVNAILADNRKLMGKNYLNVTINGYKYQEDFKLYDTVYHFVDPENIVIGENEILIECYDDAIDTIVVTGTGIAMEGYVDGDGMTIMRGTIDMPGTYTVNVCGTGACDMPICEEHTIVVPKWDLKLIDFGNWENPLNQPNDDIVIEFEPTPFAEDIVVTLYYDNPLNVIAVVQTNTQSSTAVQYNLLENLPAGRHTIYAQYNGESDYYNAFTYEADADILNGTYIVGSLPDEVELGFSVTLSLLTLEYDNTIVHDGTYLINGVEYGVDDTITITPDTVGEYEIFVQYVGVGRYSDCEATFTINVLPNIYAYYVSETGSDENSGRDPAHPFEHIATAVSAIESEELIAVMAGEYEENLIDNNTDSHKVVRLYGYNKDNVEDIKVTLHYLAPNTTLIVDDMMLGTGNGYVMIEEPTIFKNNGDTTIELDIIPRKILTHISSAPLGVIALGDSINLSLLTLDYNNNIISDGKYVINDEEYGINDEIILTPQEIGEFRIDIQYVGTGIYNDSELTLTVNVLPHIYDYYVSTDGNDNNDGTKPTTPFENLSTAIDALQNDEIIGVMAGEYTQETVSNNTDSHKVITLYGYNGDNTADIKVTIYEISPQTTLIVNNLMLDSGSGYILIDRPTIFINNGDSDIRLDVLPQEEIQ